MALRNLVKLFHNNRSLYNTIRQRVSFQSYVPVISRSSLRLYQPLVPKRLNFIKTTTKVALGLSLLSWLGFADEDKDEESELIMTLKRAVLCTRREQYDTAEQLLHLALRIAQQTQNQQGVLYCYDLMANLAFDRFELDKAEKLFVTVLQMLLSGGAKQNDLKVIHISLKLARLNQLKAEIDKADLGYTWCMEQIEKQKNDSVDAQMLYGIIQDWYAQFLLDIGDVKRSLVHLKEAYNTCKQTKGGNSEQSMLLLNDLGITSFRAGELDNAQKYLTEAIAVGHTADDKTHLGVVHANLGLIMLEKGITREAAKYCREAWKLGKKHENNESIEQANYCFDQIKMTLGK